MERGKAGAGGRTRAIAGAAALAVVAASWLTVGSSAGAALSAPAGFTASASAGILRATVRVEPPIALDPLADPAYGVAQVELDSTGTSNGFAASVYPTSAYGALPGLLPLLAPGLTLPLPANPLQVSSSHPTQPGDTRSIGPIVARSDSSETRSAASATDGITKATASASADPESGAVTVSASAGVDVVRLTEVIGIVGLRSTATVARSASGEVTRSSSFDIAGIDVLGQRIALTRHDLELLGQHVALPDLSAVGQLLRLLDPLGIEVHVLEEREIPDGIVSAGLEISLRLAIPPELGGGLQGVSATVEVGSSQAVLQSGVSTPPPPAEVTPTVDPPRIDEGVLPPISSEVPPLPPPTGGIPPVVGEVTSTPPTRIRSIPAAVSVAGLYPVLVLSGAAAYVAARWHRRTGGPFT